MTLSDDCAPRSAQPQWLTVDEGWGRRVADFATLSEPANCREYAALHQLLGVGPGDQLIDLACGAGLSLELAAAHGASCFGIDASPRLVAVARDRLPAADIRVGDMNELPWGDASFDVVTSFRGIWGTTPDAIAEARRILRPGGRIGLTVWGHIKASAGAWALAPFALASSDKVAGQARMVSLGRPGAGEKLLTEAGFTRIRRHDIPFAWEFATPADYARAIAATGPAYEAIQTVGEAEFLRYAEAQADQHVRDGLPLRAEIKVVGYTATAPGRHDPASRLISDVARDGLQDFFAADQAEIGYVMNATRLWARDNEAHDLLFALLGHVASTGGLSYRDRAVLVTASAATRGDPYCSLAWGQRLAALVGAEQAAALVRGEPLANRRDDALASWARLIARDPSGTSDLDVAALRDVGLDDDQVFAATAFVGLRIAFSTTNNALGATPDDQLRANVPAQLRMAVDEQMP